MERYAVHWGGEPGLREQLECAWTQTGAANLPAWHWLTFDDQYREVASRELEGCHRASRTGAYYDGVVVGLGCSIAFNVNPGLSGIVGRAHARRHVS